MVFEVLPTIDIMLALYSKPRSSARFDEYIQLLQGNSKGDLKFPISGFNPMAKEHVVEKLIELKALNAEKIIEDVLIELNKKNSHLINKKSFKVALNLSDDLKGGWTNRFTSDYDSKFKLNALITRNFCTPIFWTSETFSEAIIQQRTLEYVYRTIYWLNNPKPNTLKEHIDQEKFVAKEVNLPNKKAVLGLSEVFYNKYKETTDYCIIFNFFYGDNASKSLEFPIFGTEEEMAGFNYAQASA